MGIPIIQDKYSVGSETLSEFSDSIATIVFATFMFQCILYILVLL